MLVMATRDSAATKQRILDAATAEFAEFGLAGARVDRIAARGRRQQAAHLRVLRQQGRAVRQRPRGQHRSRARRRPFTAGDLPAYAAALFDFAVAHPQLARLVRWHQLERPGVMNQLPETAASNKRKLDAVAAAQKAGTVSAALPADQLFALLLTLIHGGAETHVASGDDLAVQRETLVAAVRRLTSPA
jgi:hypothetical protein